LRVAFGTAAVKRRALVWTGLRAAVALAAIAYLVSAMNWHDQLVLPPGLDLAGLPPSSAARSARVESADGAVLHMRIGDVMVDLPRERLGAGPQQPHLTPGLLSIFAAVNGGALLAVVLVVAAVMPIQALRWWLLLRARGIAPAPLQTLRLQLIGCFWNCLFPGLTGGDAVKAWQVAQGSGRTADAIMSVLVDRIIGLLALFLLAALAGTALGDSSAHHELAWRIRLVLLVIVPCCALWLSRALNRWTGLDRVIAWSLGRPRLAPAVGALVAYRDHHGTLAGGLALSLIGHVLMLGACILAGRAIGIATPWPELFMMLSLVFLIGAVPISLFGLGIMEVSAVALLSATASANQVVSMLVIYRMAVIASAVPGGLLLIGTDVRWGGPGAVVPKAGGP
jgi:glycosyltransferase 2 family protein